MSPRRRKNGPRAVERSGKRCAREGCAKYAKGDEFCSAACCRFVFGLEAKPPKKAWPDDKGVVEFTSPGRNLDRHEGPQRRQQIRMRG